MMDVRLVCDSHDLTLLRPLSEARELILNRNTVESLRFTSLTDVIGKKYSYTFRWEGLPKTDHDDLFALYEAHISLNLPVILYYDKWASSNGVDCNLTITSVRPKGLRLSYFTELSIQLDEIHPI